MSPHVQTKDQSWGGNKYVTLMNRKRERREWRRRIRWTPGKAKIEGSTKDTGWNERGKKSKKPIVKNDEKEATGKGEEEETPHIGGAQQDAEVAEKGAAIKTNERQGGKARTKTSGTL